MHTHKYILDETVAAQKMQRMALEITEQLVGDDTTELIIIGIEGGGKVIAQTITEMLLNKLPMPVTFITAKMNKDFPETITLSQEVNFDHKNVLIADDVANSGKTLLYALKPLLNFHPKRIQTLVLVERMYKRFPVKPDYVGLSVATTSQDFIHVEVANGVIKGAYISS